MSIPVMAHLVLGYPTLSESLATAEQYIAAGVQILELQIPFSHPTADGPVITAACQEATRQGITVRDCLRGIFWLRTQYPQQEIMVMSYLNRVYAFGYEAFMLEMQELGIRHVIVPDLPVRPHSLTGRGDAAPETQRGRALSANSLSLSGGQGRGVMLVPVLAANVSDARLAELLAGEYDFFYLMSDFKITGSGFSLHPRLQSIIHCIKTAEGGICRRVGIGFGISTPEQARWVASEADVAIVGSALIQARQRGELADYLAQLKAEWAEHSRA